MNRTDPFSSGRRPPGSKGWQVRPATDSRFQSESSPDSAALSKAKIDTGAKFAVPSQCSLHHQDHSMEGIGDRSASPTSGAVPLPRSHPRKDSFIRRQIQRTRSWVNSGSTTRTASPAASPTPQSIPVVWNEPCTYPEPRSQSHGSPKKSNGLGLLLQVSTHIRRLSSKLSLRSSTAQSPRSANSINASQLSFNHAINDAHALRRYPSVSSSGYGVPLRPSLEAPSTHDTPSYPFPTAHSVEYQDLDYTKDPPNTLDLTTAPPTQVVFTDPPTVIPPTRKTSGNSSQVSTWRSPTSEVPSPSTAGTSLPDEVSSSDFFSRASSVTEDLSHCVELDKDVDCKRGGFSDVFKGNLRGPYGCQSVRHMRSTAFLNA